MAEAERAIDIGHNQPPSPTDLLREELENSAATILRRRDELLAAMERVPTVIMDETVCGRVADFVKQVTGCYKLAENARTAAKEPHLSAGRIVDGFFKGITDPLEKIRRSLDQRLTVYQRAKADAERRAREAEAERQRIEAERLRREAEEAAAKLEAEADLPDAVAAEQAAEQAAADAAKAQQEAEAKAAELSRTRGDYGAVASLRTFFDFRDFDRETIDLNALRHHLNEDDIKKAIRSFIRAGGRKLDGCVIFENTTTTVR